MPTRRLALTLPALILIAGFARDLNAQGDPPRGGTFEFGTVIGRGSFSNRSGLDSCPWVGVRVGHRFAPFKGNERIQLGFRTGWEACFSNLEETGDVDVVHLSATFLFGYRASNSWLLYWGAGLGELLGDATPG